MLNFGTSGLRGLVTELDGSPASLYTRAFVETMSRDGALAKAAPVYIGRDLRGSSPSIAARVAGAVRAAGFAPVDCGALPTPALALAAMQAGAPSIMVTGSHIPDDRNGLKFYRPTGEIDKADEAKITALHSGYGAHEDVPPPATGATPARDPVDAYIERYTAFYDAKALAGLRIGVYQHSSVARDLLMRVLGALGAEPIALGRAARFLPVDTEAIRHEDIALARQWAQEIGFDALVSTDGDADRPLIADTAGQFLRGDLVGALTARHLGLSTIVTPVTSNSGLDHAGFAKVIRTRVGSPFVIAAMAETSAKGTDVLGFEANGGVLLGADVVRGSRTLAALPTRDALLPILAVLAEIAATGESLAAMAKGAGFHAAGSTRIEACAADISGPFLRWLAEDQPFADAFFAARGGIASLDQTDGLRFATQSGEIVHFRASGNAPELRVYVEAPDERAITPLLDWAVAAARAAMAA